MTFLGFLFTALVVYLAFRLVFDFILPVYRTTRRVRKGFREMQERMQQAQQGPRPGQPEPGKPADDKLSGLGEYIEFEEVK